MYDGDRWMDDDGSPGEEMEKGAFNDAFTPEASTESTRAVSLTEMTRK